MTPTIKELVELNHSDARLIAQLRANAKRRCQLMKQGGRELVTARVIDGADIEPMVVRPKPDEE